MLAEREGPESEGNPLYCAVMAAVLYCCVVLL